MALAHLGEPTQLLSELSFTQAKFHIVREARRWFETHSSSHLSDALVAVGIKKKKWVASKPYFLKLP